MNKSVEVELNKLTVAKPQKIKENYFFIPKFKEITLQENNCYVIKLHDTLLHPNPNSILVTNWNGGVIPKHTYYKCVIVKIMKPMVKIEGIAFDYNNRKDINSFFSGWLPLNEIEILEDLGGSVNG